MTTSLARLVCPTCGALLGEDATRGAVRCDFCGKRSVLTEATLVAPRFFLPPSLDRSAALLALRRALLAEGVLSPSLRSAVQPVDMRLVFVPFHVARGIRSGVVERPAEARMTREPSPLPDGVPEVHVLRREKTARDDRARVVLTDVERAVPAVRREGWGLESIAPGALVAGGVPIEAFDPDTVPRIGAVLAVEVEPADVVSRLRGETARGDTALHVPAVRTVLVPVWRIRTSVRGGLYDATVDAVEGRLLSARAPENDDHRVPIAFATLGLAALALGWVLRVFVVWPLSHGAAVTLSQSIDALFWAAMVLLLLLAMFATYAWNVVRYDAERVFENGSLRVEYPAKPPLTGLEAFWNRVFGGLGRVFDPTKERGRRD
jgi:hypothetical protein